MGLCVGSQDMRPLYTHRLSGLHMRGDVPYLSWIKDARRDACTTHAHRPVFPSSLHPPSVEQCRKACSVTGGFRAVPLAASEVAGCRHVTLAVR